MARKEDDLTMHQRAEKLIDELYRENDLLKSDKHFLHDRCEQLEALVKEYRELLQAWDTIGPAPYGANPNAYKQQYRAAETRYREVFGEQEGKA